ncbi:MULTISPECIES: hypothetical protein [unclassified Pseudomonas]|uniref:hypothetical protein n=1 Tax=unclassified Pseudomonas TaxID=196821 RepID=UPI001F59BBD9|nr:MULTISPECIES: hypothetical protein [unclassified Pseudomonas]
MIKKVGRKTTVTAIAIRMHPKLRHLLDVVGRKQRRSMTAVIEAAIEAFASSAERDIAESTWSTDENERAFNLYLTAPDLCSFDEEVDAKAALAARSK